MQTTKRDSWTYVAAITTVACFSMGGIYGYGSQVQTAAAGLAANAMSQCTHNTSLMAKALAPQSEYVQVSELRSRELIARTSTKTEEERYLRELELEGFKKDSNTFAQPGSTGWQARQSSCQPDGFGQLASSLQRFSDAFRNLTEVQTKSDRRTR